MFLKGLDSLTVGVIPPDLRARSPPKVTFFRHTPLPFSPFLPLFLPFFHRFIALWLWGCLPFPASVRTPQTNPTPANP